MYDGTIQTFQEGKAFHTREPAAEKLLSTKLLCVRERTQNVPLRRGTPVSPVSTRVCFSQLTVNNNNDNNNKPKFLTRRNDRLGS